MSSTEPLDSPPNPAHQSVDTIEWLIPKHQLDAIISGNDKDPLTSNQVDANLTHQAALHLRPILIDIQNSVEKWEEKVGSWIPTKGEEMENSIIPLYTEEVISNLPKESAQGYVIWMLEEIAKNQEAESELRARVKCREEEDRKKRVAEGEAE